jgi:hypothetical protein
MAESKLTKFLQLLTTSQAARRRFREKPTLMMSEAGLSRAQKKLLRSRRVKDLSRAIQTEQAEITEPIVCVLIVDRMPGFWNMEDERTVRATKTKRTAARTKKGKSKR